MSTARVLAEKQAKAYEDKGKYFAKEGFFKEAAEEFRRAAQQWKKASNEKQASICEAKTLEYLAMKIQDEQVFKSPSSSYLGIENHLNKAANLLKKADEYFKASRIEKRLKFLQEIFSALEGLLAKEYTQALEIFEKAESKAQAINDVAQVHFIRGFKHKCRSYIVDFPEKIVEIESAIKEFEAGKWPRRTEEARIYLLELNAINSKKQLDYDKAISYFRKAQEKWNALGNSKRSILCGLDITACRLDKEFFTSPSPIYSKLCEGYYSLAQEYRKINRTDDAEWFEISAELCKAIHEKDNDSFVTAKKKLESKYPTALEPLHSTPRRQMRIKILLDQSSNIMDFERVRKSEMEGRVLELQVRALISSFDNSRIEEEIFVSEPRQEITLHNYHKVYVFERNKPVYEEEQQYKEKSGVQYPIEVDVVAEREIAKRFHILVVETGRKIKGEDIIKLEKKAGAVMAYYEGKSRSEIPQRNKPIIDGKWLVTLSEVDENLVKKAKEYGIKIMGKKGLNMLFDKFHLKKIN